MEFQQALKLLEDGMTLEQVMQLRDAEQKGGAADNSTNDKPAATDPAPTDTQQQEDIPAWAQSLNGNIEKLTRTIQAQAIVNSSRDGINKQTVQEQADAVLSGLFAKPMKEEKNDGSK
jgi:hypothetical protein